MQHNTKLLISMIVLALMTSLTIGVAIYEGVNGVIGVSSEVEQSIVGKIWLSIIVVMIFILGLIGLKILAENYIDETRENKRWKNE